MTMGSIGADFQPLSRLTEGWNTLWHKAHQALTFFHHDEEPETEKAPEAQRWGLVATDIIDHDDLTTGTRKEGAYFALYNLANKSAHGVTIMIAVAPYTATSEADIDLKVGDVFLRTAPPDGDWSFGRIGDAFGEYATAAARPHTGVTSKTTVQAMCPYTTEDTTELPFAEGDVIEVVTDADPGWWLGVLNNRIGYFPSNYVSAER